MLFYFFWFTQLIFFLCQPFAFFTDITGFIRNFIIAVFTTFLTHFVSNFLFRYESEPCEPGNCFQPSVQIFQHGKPTGAVPLCIQS